MTIADTSAWVAHLRDSDGLIADALEALRARRELAITEPVAMEVLAGARNLAHERALRRQLSSASLIPAGNLEAWEAAARIYRVCREKGVTLRSQLDCLIAAVAIREEIPVLHADRDFDLIAAHTPLQVVTL